MMRMVSLLQVLVWQADYDTKVTLPPAAPVCYSNQFLRLRSTSSVRPTECLMLSHIHTPLLQVAGAFVSPCSDTKEGIKSRAVRLSCAPWLRRPIMESSDTSKPPLFPCFCFFFSSGERRLGVESKPSLRRFEPSPQRSLSKPSTYCLST